ncbi:MAG TPA: DNA repair protein RecO [Firmicutes bacterium]|nr:DNA repair protein RecO [Bacillota bacterium]
MSLVRVEGLVLRTKELGEADRIVTLLTKQQGKIRTAARGARRGRSALSAVCQPFAHGSYLIYMSKRSLHSINQGELVRPFRRLREDLVCLAYAAYFAELTDLCLPEEEPNDTVFDLLSTAFNWLEQGTGRFAVFARWFELHLIDLVGFRPELESCIHCRSGLNPNLTAASLGFSIDGGGIVCNDCISEQASAHRINGAVWKSMRYLLAAAPTRLDVFHPTKPVVEAMAHLLQSYIEYRFEKRIQALTFLQSVVSIPEA